MESFACLKLLFEPFFPFRASGFMGDVPSSPSIGLPIPENNGFGRKQQRQRALFKEIKLHISRGQICHSDIQLDRQHRLFSREGRGFIFLGAPEIHFPLHYIIVASPREFSSSLVYISPFSLEMYGSSPRDAAPARSFLIPERSAQSNREVYRSEKKFALFRSRGESTRQSKPQGFRNHSPAWSTINSRSNRGHNSRLSKLMFTLQPGISLHWIAILQKVVWIVLLVVKFCATAAGRNW